MGAGAVGSYIGHKLAQIRINATLIARGSHLESMQKNGHAKNCVLCRIHRHKTRCFF